MLPTTSSICAPPRPCRSHASNGLFFPCSCLGRNDHHFLTQCGCHSALCYQRGQQHHVRHETTPAGYLLPDAFLWLPVRLHSLCSLPPQPTVGVLLGLTVLKAFLVLIFLEELGNLLYCGNLFLVYVQRHQ